jgi:hypothetical protein
MGAFPFPLPDMSDLMQFMREQFNVLNMNMGNQPTEVLDDGEDTAATPPDSTASTEAEGPGSGSSPAVSLAAAVASPIAVFQGPDGAANFASAAALFQQMFANSLMAQQQQFHQLHQHQQHAPGMAASGTGAVFLPGVHLPKQAMRADEPHRATGLSMSSSSNSSAAASSSLPVSFLTLPEHVSTQHGLGLGRQLQHPPLLGHILADVDGMRPLINAGAADANDADEDDADGAWQAVPSPHFGANSPDGSAQNTPQRPGMGGSASGSRLMHRLSFEESPSAAAAAAATAGLGLTLGMEPRKLSMDISGGGAGVALSGFTAPASSDMLAAALRSGGALWESPHTSAVGLGGGMQDAMGAFGASLSAPFASVRGALGVGERSRSFDLQGDLGTPFGLSGMGHHHHQAQSSLMNAAVTSADEDDDTESDDRTEAIIESVAAIVD